MHAPAICGVASNAHEPPPLIAGAMVQGGCMSARSQEHSETSPMSAIISVSMTALHRRGLIN